MNTGYKKDVIPSIGMRFSLLVVAVGHYIRVARRKEGNIPCHVESNVMILATKYAHITCPWQMTRIIRFSVEFNVMIPSMKYGHDVD